MSSELYVVYPRKVGKAGALKAIQKAIATVASRGPTDKHPNFEGSTGTAFDWLKSRVTAYANSPQGQREDRSFIPYPATWFNDARYDDDDAEWRPSSGRG